MGDIQQQVLIENIIWISSLMGPCIVSVFAVVLARRSGADRIRISFIGAMLAFAVGAAGSFWAGEILIGAIIGGGDIPFYLVAQAWHRMWYPLGIGLLVGFGLALFALLPQSSTA